MPHKCKPFQDELTALIKKDFPDLDLCVGSDRSWPWVQVCEGYIWYKFAIDKNEWEMNTPDQREKLIKIRFLRALRNAKLSINKIIRKIKNAT